MEKTVDINKVGDYTVTHTATDANGKTATANAVVKVQDTTAPVISLAATTIEVENSASVDAVKQKVSGLYSATDLSAVTVTVSITKADDTSGTAKIVAVDASGNKTEKSVSVKYKTPEPTPDPEPTP